MRPLCCPTQMRSLRARYLPLSHENGKSISTPKENQHNAVTTLLKRLSGIAMFVCVFLFWISACCWYLCAWKASVYLAIEWILCWLASYVRRYKRQIDNKRTTAIYSALVKAKAWLKYNNKPMWCMQLPLDKVLNLCWLKDSTGTGPAWFLYSSVWSV